MAPQPQPYYAPDEYLALERAAAYKSEYLAGQILPMARVNETHNTITGNLVWRLGTQFQGRPCRVFASNMRVRVAPSGLYTYPDVVAVCGPREFADDERDTLLNPTVIFEVLSPSTEAYDRGKKFALYQRLASLTDYVLVAQDQVRVEHYARQGNGWFVTAADALDATVRLASIDAALALAAVYDNVEFPAAEPAV